MSNEDWKTLGIVLALVTGIWSLVVQIRRFPLEYGAGVVDLANKYRLLAIAEIERRENMGKRLEEVEARLEKRVVEMEREVHSANRRADKFERWARNLCAQLNLLNITPVSVDDPCLPSPQGHPPDLYEE